MEASPTIKSKPIKGFGRLGKWLNGLLDDVKATEPRAGDGLTVTNGTSGSGKLVSIKTETYYVIINGRLFQQRFCIVDQPVEITK